MKRIIVYSISGFVVAIGILLTLLMFEAMRMTRGNAEWDITVFAGTGVALLALAGTIIWRTQATHMAWWEVAEAAIQYALSGGLLAWAALNHLFYAVSVAYSQAHLVVSALFCAWNLLWVYRARTRPK